VVAAALDGLSWSPDRGTAGTTYRAAKAEWDKCAEIGAPRRDSSSPPSRWARTCWSSITSTAPSPVRAWPCRNGRSPSIAAGLMGVFEVHGSGARGAGETTLIGVVQVRSNTQLRVLALSIVVSLCLVASACGSSTTPSSSTPATSAAPTTLHLPDGQAVDVGGTWNVSNGDSFYLKSYRGEHLALIVVTMKNISSASQNADPSSWSLADSSGKTYAPLTGATVSMSGNSSLAATTLGPGESASGFVSFSVPKPGKFTLIFTSGSSTASWDISVS